jgi:alpha-tubulin suppressor-like RCC1 family protein
MAQPSSSRWVAPAFPFLCAIAGSSGGCVLITASQEREKQAEVEDTSGVGSEAWVQLAAGENFTCGLHDNGSIDCWGLNDKGQTNALTQAVFTQVTAGVQHTCALQGEPNVGVPLCWGDAAHGATVPPDVPFTKIAAGGFHNCGIQTDGTALCWGENQDGQSNVVPGETYRDIAAGRHHTCAVKSNGSLVCWGEGDCDQTQYPGGNEWVRVYAGEQVSCALDNAGEITCWGAAELEGCDYTAGTLDIPSTDPTDPDEPWVWADMSAGAFHNCGLTTLGEVFCWGESSDNRTVIDDDYTYVQVVAGGRHTCALTQGNEIVCNGYDVYGQCNPPVIEPDTGKADGA